jgi:hypothetical protein
MGRMREIQEELEELKEESIGVVQPGRRHCRSDPRRAGRDRLRRRGRRGDAQPCRDPPGRARALILAFAGIGAIAGRAKVFQRRGYGLYEREVEHGDALVSVSGPPEELGRAREIIVKGGAIAIRHEETGEAL